MSALQTIKQSGVGTSWERGQATAWGKMVRKETFGKGDIYSEISVMGKEESAAPGRAGAERQ